MEPRAKPGLLASDHSKRGQRFVTVVDERTLRVSLLAPWEHAVLVLCDGERTAAQIAALLREGIEGESVTAAGVARCFQFFSREGLLENANESLASAGPRTLANLQQAYREWHKDPVKTGRILSGLLTPPFLDDPPPFQASMEPTVALADDEQAPVAVGSTLVVGESGADPGARALRSVLDPETLTESKEEGWLDEELANVEELLAAVDSDLAAGLADTDDGLAASPSTERDAAARSPTERESPRAVGGTADLPAPHSTAADAVPLRAESRSTTETGALVPEPTKRFRHRQLSEAALTPTLVGQAPPEGHGPPVIVSPPRSPSRPSSSSPPPSSPPSSPRSAGHRVMATVGPEPDPPVDASAPEEDALAVAESTSEDPVPAQESPP